jgi:hypothetical protein
LAYSYITFAELKSALLQRLQDQAGVFTTSAEAGVYITEALRVLNAQTATWNQEFILDFIPGTTWRSINFDSSPRERTVTDTSIYTEMEYMLLEPPTGSVWTGTNQFNITNLSEALQYRRDELLQASGANTVNIITPSPTSGRTTTLSDATLELRRVRWIPVPESNESPYALWREDVVTVNAYGNELNITPGSPESWLITSNAPLSFDVSCPPFVPGDSDLLSLQSGANLTPPTSTVLGLPDDWCWVAKYGALADALSNSPEASDAIRAKYCQQRYERGMKAMTMLPWLLSASVANLPVDTPSVQEMDAYAQNWENTWPAGDPQIVVGGMDFVALAPFVPVGGMTVSAALTVVGNAPIPAGQGDFIQLTRDGVDAVLAYAQHIAMFKCGGDDFTSTLPLYMQFEAFCASQNKRFAALGTFRSEMILEGDRGEVISPRMLKEAQEKDA